MPDNLSESHKGRRKLFNTMQEKTGIEDDVYPPDMEAPGSDHQFFVELCELIEGYEGDRTHEELLYDTRFWATYWINQHNLTGQTWEWSDE